MKYAKLFVDYLEKGTENRVHLFEATIRLGISGEGMARSTWESMKYFTNKRIVGRSGWSWCIAVFWRRYIRQECGPTNTAPWKSRRFISVCGARGGADLHFSAFLRIGRVGWWGKSLSYDICLPFPIRSVTILYSSLYWLQGSKVKDGRSVLL